jgi:hypothetical protein
VPVFLYVSILLLALFDIVATHYSIAVYGTFAIEKNPIMRWVMEDYGLRAAYIVRMGMVTGGLILVGLVHRMKEGKRIGLFALRAALVIHLTIAAYHLWITEFFTIHG